MWKKAAARNEMTNATWYLYRCSFSQWLYQSSTWPVVEGELWHWWAHIHWSSLESDGSKCWAHSPLEVIPEYDYSTMPATTFLLKYLVVPCYIVVMPVLSPYGTYDGSVSDLHLFYHCSAFHCLWAALWKAFCVLEALPLCSAPYDYLPACWRYYTIIWKQTALPLSRWISLFMRCLHHFFLVLHSRSWNLFLICRYLPVSLECTWVYLLCMIL